MRFMKARAAVLSSTPADSQHIAFSDCTPVPYNFSRSAKLHCSLRQLTSWVSKNAFAVYWTAIRNAIWFIHRGAFDAADAVRGLGRESFPLAAFSVPARQEKGRHIDVEMLIQRLDRGAFLEQRLSALVRPLQSKREPERGGRPLRIPW